MKNMINYYLLVLIFILTGSTVFAAEGFNPVNKASNSVLDYFQPLQGTISKVDEESVTATFDNGADVKKGMRFSVFREGAPFYHPVTNEVIGKSEDFIGRVELKNILPHEGLQEFSIVEGDVKEGDIVRITSSKIKLAFFQDRKADWNLSERFYKSIKDSGRFIILEKYTPVYEPAHLSGIARELGAEALLMFSTPSKDEEKLLDVKLLWSKDAKIFGEITEVVGSDTLRSLGPDDAFISAAAADTEPWGSYKVDDGRLMAMGDVDGNGDQEFVLSDGNSIKIYSLKDELREMWHIKGANSEKHLSIDILDMNNNGVAEIFVTSLMDEEGITNIDDDIINASRRNQAKMSSYVIEYDTSEGYRKLADNMAFFLRVTGKSLLMQKYALRGFGNTVYEAEWNGEKYVPGTPLQLPDGVNIYGFAYVDWQNKGQRNVITYDDNGYLILYDEQGNSIWNSSKSYGKFELTFARKTYSLANATAKWSVRGRLIPVNTERGQEIVVVSKLPFVSRVPGLGSRGAEVYSLWWDGASMDEKIMLSEVSGTVSDFWIEGSMLFLVARGDLLSYVKNAVSGELERGSVLYYYNFGK